MFFRLPSASVSLVLQHLVHADAAQQEKDPGVPQSGQELPPESIPIKEGIRQPPPEKGYKIAENKADAVPSRQYVLPSLHGAVDAALCADKAHKADKRKAYQRGKTKKSTYLRWNRRPGEGKEKEVSAGKAAAFLSKAFFSIC